VSDTSDETVTATGAVPVAELPTTVVVREKTITFVVPASWAVRYSIFECSQDQPLYASAAAIGVCCPEVGRRKPYNGKPGAYGAALFDYLIESGWSYRQINDVGAIALAHIVRSLPEWKRVQKTQSFFDEAAQEPLSSK
jgi:hypothetical protein